MPILPNLQLPKQTESGRQRNIQNRVNKKYCQTIIVTLYIRRITKYFAVSVDVVAVRIDPQRPVQPPALDDGLELQVELLLLDVVLRLELDLHEDLAREPPVDLVVGLPLPDAVVEHGLSIFNDNECLQPIILSVDTLARRFIHGGFQI